MDNHHIIPVTYSGSGSYRTRAVYQYDYGQILSFDGFDLPDAFEVHFYTGGGESVTVIGHDDQVAIPDSLLQIQRTVTVWLFLHDTEDDGETRFVVEIPVRGRSAITDEEPTPVEQSVITQAIAALNAGVEAAEDAQGAAEAAQASAESYAESAGNSAITATNAATSAATSAGNAAASATSAGSSATDANASRQAADLSATNAGISERNAAASATTAAGSATSAATSAGQASASATAASGSASTASAKAGEAAQSATAAAGSAASASEDAGTASTAATAAGQSATAAAGSATAAAGSATAASGSAEAASGSAGAAAESARQAAETVEEISGVVQDVSELKSAIDELGPVVDDLNINKADVIINTASGSIASFSDGADDLPVKSLSVAIEPVQDLHGYDSPWPEGGGANKWDEAFEIGAISISTGEELVREDQIRAKNYMAVSPGDVYYVLANPGLWFLFYDANKSVLTSGLPTGQQTAGNARMFQNSPLTIPDGCNFVRFYFQTSYGTTYKNDTAINYPSTVTTYSPYSNICPITGWTWANVWDDPKHVGLIKWNQLAHELSADYWYTNSTTSAVFNGGVAEVHFTVQYGQLLMLLASAPDLIENHKYLVMLDAKVSSGNNLFRMYCTSGMSFDNITPTTDYARYSAISTATRSYSKDRLVIQNNASSDFGTLFVKNICFIDITAMFGAGNEPSTAEEFKDLFPNDYYPFDDSYAETCVSAVNGDPYRHYPITIPTEAGTVYGGKLTVNEDGTGQVVVDRAEVDLGSLNWTYRESITAFSSSLLGYKKASSGSEMPNILSSAYKAVTIATMVNTAIENGVVTVGRPNAWDNFVLVRNKDYTDAASFKAVVTGQQLVYELATPITYTLTASQVQTLLGVNNIWADTGDIENVSYRADTKTYVDAKEPEIPVQDVQVNGVSVLQDGVANVPKASSAVLGVAKIDGDYGVAMFSGLSAVYNDKLYANRATDSQVKAEVSAYRPIVPSSQHLATFYGLAKAAGSDEKNSTLPVGSYTESAKSAISEMLNGSVSVSGTTPTINALPGLRYVCGEVSTLDVTVPASGIVDVVFESGSTATVLTITGTVKWANGFDPTSLDANTTYEINIADGLGVAASWT